MSRYTRGWIVKLPAPKCLLSLWQAVVNMTGRTMQSKLGKEHPGYVSQTRNPCPRQHHELGFMDEYAGMGSPLSKGPSAVFAQRGRAHMIPLDIRVTVCCESRPASFPLRQLWSLPVAHVIALGRTCSGTIRPPDRRLLFVLT